MNNQELIEQIHKLEQKYDFQEQTIEELSKQILILNKKSIEQEATLKQVIEMLKNNQKSDREIGGNEKPPHY